MAVINVLSPLVANMIAAGEVLERPASAVKELIENSLDAGANRIIIEIESGGKKRIKVTDNGCGMEPQDARNCFLRHATSKIKDSSDLESIATMGFRGEALASIAAVSRVRLITRTEGSIEGTGILVEAAEVKDEYPVGCGVGTSVEITDLFFNTPARMKFLKSDSTEAAQITETVEKFIISRPDVSFKLIKNGREALYSAGNFDALGNLTNIYGREITDNIKKIDYKEEGIAISGFIGNERILKPGRKYQSFFVNGRTVRNKIFFAAVDEAMKEKAIGGLHPFVILMLDIDPSYTDVNVHPTKAEIKFTDDRRIYGIICRAVESAFTVKGMEDKKPEQKEEIEEISFFEDKPLDENQVVKFGNPFSPPAEPEVKPYNASFNEVKTSKFEALKPVVKESPSSPEYKAPEKKEETVRIKLRPAAPEASAYTEKNPDVPAEKADIKKASEVAEVKEESVKVSEAPADYRIVGQIFGTYVIIEKDERMYLMDQHAAHERLIFDRIKRELEENELVTQPLFMPYIIKLTPTEHSLVCENKELFSSMGFDVEDFGDGSVAVREVPFSMNEEDISSFLSEICIMLEENKTALVTVKQEKAVATLACKAAIKGNNRYSEFELEALVKSVLSDQKANTCPHGRPLFAEFDKKTIDKQFRRI